VTRPTVVERLVDALLDSPGMTIAELIEATETRREVLHKTMAHYPELFERAGRVASGLSGRPAIIYRLREGDETPPVASPEPQGGTKRGKAVVGHG